MATTVTTKLALPAELVTSMFDKTMGHSTLAKLCGASPVSFNGNQVMTFNLDGEVSIVGEGANKPAGSAVIAPVTITPIKVVYQHRLTDEFLYASDEAKLPYLQAFTEGFAKKIARGLDIMAFHGVNPADGVSSSAISSKSFDTMVTTTVTATTAPDEDIDDAVAAIQAADGTVTGMAMDPTTAAKLGKMKASGTGEYMYPEFRFGANPATFGGMASDVNNTVNFNSSDDRVIIGDFQNAFRWGYAKNVPMEVIEFGDPDGLGDLKRTNQVVLRAEAYIGWGILAAEYFARVTNA